MATKLRKYKYGGPPSTRPETSSTQVSTAPGDPPSISQSEPVAATEDWKADILSSLRKDISSVIRAELKNAFSEDFGFLKSELKEVKSEIANNTAAIRSELDNMKTAIRDVEEGLSTWSDEIASLQTTVADLQSELANLKEKNDNLEGRMRRCNVRIAGIPEETGSSSTTAISSLLKEVLKMEKDVLIDRSHRGLTPKKPNRKPRVVVAKLHYFQDCVEVLRRAREQGPLRYKGEAIAISPDFTAKVARERAAFNDVRNLLRGRRDVRYGIIFPARLRITYRGDNKEFIDPEKAMAYVRSMTQGEETAK